MVRFGGKKEKKFVGGVKYKKDVNIERNEEKMGDCENRGYKNRDRKGKKRIRRYI